MRRQDLDTYILAHRGRDNNALGSDSIGRCGLDNMGEEAAGVKYDQAINILSGSERSPKNLIDLFKSVGCAIERGEKSCIILWKSEAEQLANYLTDTNQLLRDIAPHAGRLPPELQDRVNEVTRDV